MQIDLKNPNLRGCGLASEQAAPQRVQKAVSFYIIHIEEAFVGF